MRSSLRSRVPLRSAPCVRVGLRAGALSLCLSSALIAQTLLGVDTAGALSVGEMTGPPAGPCGYPNGPLLSVFPYPQPFVCPLPGPALGAFAGDVGVDKLKDSVWVTDGSIVGNYDSAGLALNGFVLPAFSPIGAPITGLGVDSAAGLLWLTDGSFAFAILPPPPPGCAPPALIVAPFALPPLAGIYSDIDWDAGTGTLFLSSSAGLIANVAIGGAPGPFGIYPAAPFCALGALTGLAIDSGSPPGLVFTYVTDGFTVGYSMPGGAPAPPSFYTPIPCFPYLGPPPTSGLAFSARAITYGSAMPPGASQIAGVGQSYTPNPGFAVALSGGWPGSIAVLEIAAAALCPPLPVLGGSLYLTPPLVFFGAKAAPLGTAKFPAPIPNFVPPGSVYAQGAFVAPFPFALSSTPGLELSICRP